MSEFVASRAGDRVELVEAGPESVWKVVEPVLSALWVDGPIENRSGRAVADLHRRARAYGYPSTRMGLAHLIAGSGSLDPFIDREVRGKRTFKVRLARLPRAWAELLVEENGGERAVEPEPVDDGRTCSICGTRLSNSGNLTRHRRDVHGRSGRIVSTSLPAVIENGDNGDGPTSVLTDVNGVELVQGMMAAARTDGLVPIRLYPRMVDLTQHVDAVLGELARLTERER